MPIRSVRTQTSTAAPSRVEQAVHRRAQPALGKVEHAARPKTPPPPPRSHPRLLGLPDVRQATGYTCGTAALQSILAYYGWKGDDPNEKSLAKDLGTTWQNGTEPEEIAKLSRALGVKATIANHMELEDVAAHVRAGRPVMVAYQAYPDENGPFPNSKPWSEDWVDGHWSIVIGIDDKNVYLEDPSMLGKRGFIPRAEFLERWHDTDRKSRPVYQHMGIVFDSDVPKASRNTVDVQKLQYVP